METIILQSNFE